MAFGLFSYMQICFVTVILGLSCSLGFTIPNRFFKIKQLIINRFTSKNFSNKAVRWRFSSVVISVEKNLTGAILVFGRHFEFFSKLYFFPKIMNIFS
jgi:hypothetical protein